MKFGFRIYGFAATLLGVVGLVWDDFAGDWQPVPSDFPGRPILAYLVASILIVAGTAMQSRRFRTKAAVSLAVIYFIGAAVLHGPEVFSYSSYLSTWSGLAEQLVLVAGGLVVAATFAPKIDDADLVAARAGQVLFGACLVVFGFAHFVYLSFTAGMVPSWLPPNQTFWAAMTGLAHIAAGLAFLSGRLDLLAAGLVTLMFVGFSVLVHAPGLVKDPRSHDNWVANAINLALAGSAWVVFDSIAQRRAQPLNRSIAT